ncbi:hypothetical protein N0V82_009177 [Gnomoniopsis sp. IMI 355080]|nr:hypothetical protein N0V82_009177 [Gnomoniopsis sp. IMI 355080]
MLPSSQSNSQTFSLLLKEATRLETTKLDGVHLTDEDLLACRNALRLSEQRASRPLTPRKKRAPRMPPRPKYGANRSALSTAVDIFESAIEVVQETFVDRPRRSEAAKVQRSIVEKTLDKVVLRISWEGDRQSTEKMIMIVLFHLDADFVRPQVSFETSGNAEPIQNKCYDAALEWLSLRTTLPAVLNEHETQWENFLSFAFIRLIYGRQPDIETKRYLWDSMAVLGLREYLHSTTAVKAVFRSRLTQIYATARDILTKEAEGEISPAAIVERTLNALQPQDPHGRLSWMAVRKQLGKAALHTIRVLLYRCEAIPPDERVATDDIDRAVMCAEAATSWEHARDHTEPLSSESSIPASPSDNEPSLVCPSINEELPSLIRSSLLRSMLLADGSSLLIGKQKKATILQSRSSSQTTALMKNAPIADTGVGDQDKGEYSDASGDTIVPSSVNETVQNGTPGPAKRVYFEADIQIAEEHDPLVNPRQAGIHIQLADDIYTVVDGPFPPVDDVPSVPLHWHFVHDPEDYSVSEERGQKFGTYFGVSLESLRIKHWPRMSEDQKKEASRLRDLTIETYEAVKTAFIDLRVEYPDRREKVAVPFTELCRRHLETLNGDKKARVKRCLNIAEARETMNEGRQLAQLEHLRANGVFDATWKELRDAFIRECRAAAAEYE